MSTQLELEQKLRDAAQPGVIVELTPEEASLAGLYSEDAMSEEDALESAHYDADNSSEDLKPKWTQEESIAFECARECITDLISVYSSLLWKEEHKPAPDTSRINELRIEMTRLGQERSVLRGTHHEEIARINHEYSLQIRMFRDNSPVSEPD